MVAASFGQDALTQLLQLRVQPLTDAFASVKDAVAAYIYDAIKDAAQRQDHNVLKDSAESGSATESTESEEEGNQYGLLKKDWKQNRNTEGSL